MSDERDQTYQNSAPVTHLCELDAKCRRLTSALLLDRTVRPSCNKQKRSRPLVGPFELWKAEGFVRLPAPLEGGFASVGGNRTKIQLPQPDICQTLRPTARELAVGLATSNLQRKALRFKYESSQCLTISTHAATRKTGV